MAAMSYLNEALNCDVNDMEESLSADYFHASNIKEMEYTTIKIL